MQVEVTETEVVIRLKRINPPTLTKTEKSLMVATSNGIKETTVEVNGKPLQVGVNAFISAK